MIKIFSLILFLALTRPAAAGYSEAVGALKNAEDPKAMSKKLDEHLARPGAALAKDAGPAAMLADNQEAMELFRQAAQAPNDGFMFAPKVENPTMMTALPSLTQHYLLFRLLLLDARVSGAQRQRGRAQSDLLADPFNSFAPLSYAAAGKRFLVYSFGPDGKDNKGAAVLDQEAFLQDAARNAGDIVFAD